ncbi:hypothetical protein C8R44DRAFT_736788 [Mycena epipterygia]|nr:hypothetical protein C8R44DRAFT_740661 [Mycena epipterygia]KAJ7121101.1 hypothetical protein C8R44DRAFT_736788 [Mycena epipterygia]
MSGSGVTYYDEELTPLSTLECQAGLVLVLSHEPVPSSSISVSNLGFASGLCWIANLQQLEALNAVEDNTAQPPAIDSMWDTTLDTVTVLTAAYHFSGICFRISKPVEGADAIRSLADWSEDVVADTQGGKKASANKTWDGESYFRLYREIGL